MIYRDFLKNVSDDDLRTMFADTVTWDRSGALPLDTMLRTKTREAWKESGVEFTGGLGTDDDPGAHGLQVMNFGNEVWREIARRKLEDE